MTRRENKGTASVLAKLRGRIVNDVKLFAMPALLSLASGERLMKHWKAGRGWVAI